MEFSYTWTQWLFIFYFYCLFGWCFESTYVSLKSKQFVNRGFMRGPFLPLYGSGAVMMLVVSSPFQDHLFLTYVSGCIGATILEYVTGVGMEALFHIRYWDYSDQPFNYQGHICLSSTIAWGFLTILMTHVVHRPIEQWVLSIPENILSVVTMVITLILVVDFTLSFKAAMDLRDVLIRMEEAKQEIQRLQRRLDVIVAVLEQEKDEKLQKVENRLEVVSDSVETRMEELSQYMENKFVQLKDGKLGELSLEIKEELQELRERFHFHKEHRFLMSHRRNLTYWSIIKGNPTMKSEKFKEALEEIKVAINEYKEKKNKEN